MFSYFAAITKNQGFCVLEQNHTEKITIVMGHIWLEKKHLFLIFVKKKKNSYIRVTPVC